MRGFSLLEVMLAVGLLGIVGIGLMMGLSGAYRAQEVNRSLVVGESLVRSALEQVRSAEYLETYGEFVFKRWEEAEFTIPRGYSVDIFTEAVCPEDPLAKFVVLITDCEFDNLQRTIVRVSREGRILSVVEDLKARR